MCHITDTDEQLSSVPRCEGMFWEQKPYLEARKQESLEHICSLGCHAHELVRNRTDDSRLNSVEQESSLGLKQAIDLLWL